jgi:phosphopantothenoylcysteine decarboxylase/phosphopantothenate--cysteine ligase
MRPWTSIFDFGVTLTLRGSDVHPEKPVPGVIPPCPANLNFQTKEYVDTRNLSMKQYSRSTMTIELVRSDDILASVAALENAPFTVGFAAETENLREYAIGKLERKKLDMIVANQVGVGKGFDSDQNAVSVYWKAGEQSFDLADKQELARDLLKLIAERYQIAYSSGAYAIN